MADASVPVPTFGNERVAAVFGEIADLLEVQGENTFRVRAYRNAARTIGGLGRSAAAMLQAGEKLQGLPGIGADLAGKIAEIVTTGTCAQRELLRRETPPGFIELLRLPGFGARRLQRLHESLGIASLQDLLEAARSDRIRGVKGFGAVAQQHLLEAVTQQLRRDRRFPLPDVAETVAVLVAQLKAVPGVHDAVVAGSFRRRRDTVGDVDLLVTATRSAPVIDAFTAVPGVARVLARGTTRASIVLADELQVDLRVVAPGCLGAAWLYFTGSKPHAIALRKAAQARGLKLNEYGVYRGVRRIAGRTEASVYAALGLPWIAPELREDRGELEAARADRLPLLVETDDLRGDLHVHHGGTLGRVGLRALADAAQARRLRYLAVADRYRAGGGPGALDADGLARQFAAIDELNETLGGFAFLKGVEVTIGEDGSLDLPPIDLAGVDLVVGVAEGGAALTPVRRTERLLRAMDHASFSILAHPTGRLLPAPGAADFDLERVLRHAADRGCFVEASADPRRLDLDDTGCRMARDAGVLVSIASDAREPAGLAHLPWGVGQARRGWLEPRDVLNTRPLSVVRRLLGATLGRSLRAAEDEVDVAPATMT